MNIVQGQSMLIRTTLTEFQPGGSDMRKNTNTPEAQAAWISLSSLSQRSVFQCRHLAQVKGQSLISIDSNTWPQFEEEPGSFNRFHYDNQHGQPSNTMYKIKHTNGSRFLHIHSDRVNARRSLLQESLLFRMRRSSQSLEEHNPFYQFT